MLRTRAAVACLLMLVVWSTATVIADEVPHPTIVGAIDHSPSVYTQGLEVRNGACSNPLAFKMRRAKVVPDS